MAIMIFQKSVIGNFPVKYKITSLQSYLAFGGGNLWKLESRHEILSVSTLLRNVQIVIIHFRYVKSEKLCSDEDVYAYFSHLQFRVFIRGVI